MQCNRVSAVSRYRRWLLAVLAGGALAASAAEPLSITVAVPGPGANSFLPVELISRLGADRAEGAEVKVNYVSGGNVAMQQLTTNNVDFAIVGLPTAMSARLKDSRIVAIAPINDLPLYVLLVRQALKGQVKTVADLKGRTLGVHSSSVTTKTNSHQVLELMLAQNGVPPGSVRFVAVGQRWQSESAMLNSGDADAIIGDEPYASRMIAEKIAFPLIHLGNPADAKRLPGGGFLRGAVIAQTDQLERNPHKAEVMVRIIKRVLYWLATSSPEGIVGAAGLNGTPEGKYFAEVLVKYPRQYSRDGKFSTRQLQETETFFRASQSGNASAQALKMESMVVDHWAGRKD